MEILTKENLVGPKNCSHCNSQDFHSLSKENQVSLVRIFFLSQVQEVKSAGLGVEGGTMILNKNFKRIGFRQSSLEFRAGRFT